MGALEKLDAVGPVEVVDGPSHPRPTITRRSSKNSNGIGWFVAGLLTLDLVVVVISGTIAMNIRFADEDARIAGAWLGRFLAGVPYEMVIAAMSMLWIGSIVIRGGYSRRNLGAGADEYKRVVTATILAAGSIAVICYFGKIELARGFLAIAFSVGAVLLLVSHFAMRRVLHAARRLGHLGHRVLLVGMPAGVGEVQPILRREPRSGLVPIGCCLPRFSGDPADAKEAAAARSDVRGGRSGRDGRADRDDEDVPMLGHLEDVRRVVDETEVDTVVVTSLPGNSSRLLRRISWSLEGSGVDLVVVPSLTDVAGPRIHVRPVAGLPLLHVEEPEFGGVRRLIKGAFDWICAALALVIAAPVMLVIALAIKLDDRGPVFFRQVRVGVHGREFPCWKFRSMVIDAEQRLRDLRQSNEHDGVLFKIREDPRQTRVGRVLRRLSLDELPQLFNVLRGEMSLVGPRPPLPGEVQEYEADTRRRLLVKPGITGLWQVSGRSNLSWEDSVRLDLYYVENWSLSSDLVILAKTLRAVLSRDGAY